MSNGINQIGIPKFQHPWRSLQTSRNSGTWGNRGKGNEIQSALEKGLSWIGDKFVNGADYLEDGFNYLVTAPLAAVTGKTKEIPRVVDQMREQRHNMSQNYAMNPVFDLVSPIKGGWMLKGLMKGSPLEKQLSKAGTININGLQAYLNKASKLEQDVIGRILSSQFTGQKNIDYNALRKAISDELITYSRKPQDKYSTYGMNKLGFDLKKEYDGAGGIAKYVPGVKTQTFTFESPRVPGGDGRHYDKTTLGHSRTYTTPDEPEVLHVMESQSDWAQNKKAPNLKEYLPTEKQSVYWAIKRILEPYRQKFIEKYPQYTKQYDDYIANARSGIYDAINDDDFFEAFEQVMPIDHFKEVINRYARIKSGQNFSQYNYLQQNYLPRQLQENMLFAAEQGQKRMRYPTSETAAKIEGYKKTYPEPEYSRLKQQNEAYQRSFENGAISYDRYLELTDRVIKRLKEIQGQGQSYSPEHQTILKKYADFPKMFGRLFKGQEVRTVTDPKGNTWYEVDIPENFLQSEWQFKKGGVLGLNKIIGL